MPKKENGDLASAIRKADMNEALLLQQDGWQYIRRGRDTYYMKDRCIFTKQEVLRGLNRWARAATGKKLD